MEKKKIIHKECLFLLENFFSSIKFYLFYSKHFHLFTQHEYSNGKNLFTEEDKFEYIYFVKDGEVELSLNMNVFQIDEKIHLLSNKLNILPKVFCIFS